VFVACPAGSGCDFGRFVYGRRGENLLDLLAHGAIMPIDIGRCDFKDENGKKQRKYYINSFDVGAGADTCCTVNSSFSWMKRIFSNGHLPFLVSALKELMTFKYTATKVEADGELFEGEYLIIGAGNGAYAGGGMNLFPNARMDDGLLDVILVKRRSKIHIMRDFPRLYDGNLKNVPDLEYRQVKSVTITTQRRIPLELDGEVPGYTDTQICVLPGLLPLLKPDFDHMFRGNRTTLDK
jgi:diacylglycerol kinase family enzyme